MDFLKKKLAELISDSPFIAKALHFLGIHFALYSSHTLEELCLERGLNLEVVLQKFQEVAPDDKDLSESFKGYPIDVVIEYLRRSHVHFIKHRLPYLHRLIVETPLEDFEQSQIGRDLKLVFPLFAEDFIIHIYHEEDHLFGYIRALQKAQRNQHPIHDIAERIAKENIAHFSDEHDAHDDEMQGIRALTADYHIHTDTPLSVQVLYHELKSFERELQQHALLENKVLLPKAQVLEKAVLFQIKLVASFN